MPILQFELGSEAPFRKVGIWHGLSPWSLCPATPQWLHWASWCVLDHHECQYVDKICVAVVLSDSHRFSLPSVPMVAVQVRSTAHRPALPRSWGWLQPSDPKPQTLIPCPAAVGCLPCRSAPLRIMVCIVLLYRELGLASLMGFLFLLLTIPLQVGLLQALRCMRNAGACSIPCIFKAKPYSPM